MHLNLQSTLLKITPAPAPTLIKNIYSWYCSVSCWKTPTLAEVDSCTPASAHLWAYWIWWTFSKWNIGHGIRIL